MRSPLSETWRPVAGYEGLYEVSDFGRVRSLPRATTAGRVLKPRVQPSRGYRCVFLSRDGRITTKQVHRLVLESFVGPCPADQECRHLDGDKLNNLATNLVWGTRSQQRLDDVRNGRHAEARKTHCPAGHCYDIKRKHGGRDCSTCKNAAARRRYARTH